MPSLIIDRQIPNSQGGVELFQSRLSAAQVCVHKYAQVCVHRHRQRINTGRPWPQSVHTIQLLQ